MSNTDNTDLWENRELAAEEETLGLQENKEKHITTASAPMFDKLDIFLVELIHQERFYAELLMRMKKIADVSIPTACVSVTLDGVELRYNPHFLAQFEHSKNLTEEGISAGAAVLKHECEHILRDHLTWRFTELEPDLKDTKIKSILDYFDKCNKAQLLNLAADVEINEHIPQLPKKWYMYDKNGEVVKNKDGEPQVCEPCTVEAYQKMFPEETIKKGMTLEYYYRFLQKMQDKGKEPNKGENGSAVIPLDDHDQSAEALAKLDPEIAKEVIRQIANDSYEALSGTEKGNLPNHLTELIKSLNEKSVDWRKQLRQFTASCAATLREETKKRRNRRYGILYPGYRMKPRLHIVVAKDTSGSVNDEAQAQFNVEIAAIAAEDVLVTVIDCDSDIQQVYTYEKKFKNNLKSKGRGGTDFKPVFDLVKSKTFIKKYGKVDGLIYLTDGEDWGNLYKPNFKVLWALMPECKSKYDWGSKLHIDINQKKRRA